ncbi:MFS transporter [Thermoplasmatales archaeon AK]|nr:MFS transporter [Thermoplasmatales archaeon AK]
MAEMEAVSKDEVNFSSTWKTAGASFVSVFFHNYNNIAAALVSGIIWPSVFFPSFNPYVGLFLSLSTYVVGYIAGIVGAFIFGQYGDTSGRRNVGAVALAITAIGAIGISLTPGYTTLGVTADVLLIVFRFIAGMGIGTMVGDGAWVVESAAKSNRRGLWGTTFGVGQSLSVAAPALILFYLITSYPHAYVFSSGWRIIFYIGAVGIIVALIIRIFITDTKVFRELKDTNKVESLPAIQVFRPFWKQIMILMVVQAASAGAIFELASFTPGFLGSEGLTPLNATLALGIASIVGIAVKLLTGLLADAKGRLFAMRAGMLAVAIWAIPYLYFLYLKPSLPLLIVDEIIMYGAASIQIATVASLFAEQFASRYRYSGVTISYNFGQLLAGIVTAVIAAAILSALKGPVHSWPYIGALMLVLNVIAFGLLFTLKETFSKHIVAD